MGICSFPKIPNIILGIFFLHFGFPISYWESSFYILIAFGRGAGGGIRGDETRGGGTPGGGRGTRGGGTRGGGTRGGGARGGGTRGGGTRGGGSRRRKRGGRAEEEGRRITPRQLAT